MRVVEVSHKVQLIAVGFHHGGLVDIIHSWIEEGRLPKGHRTNRKAGSGGGGMGGGGGGRGRGEGGRVGGR